MAVAVSAALALRGVRYRYPDGQVALDGVDLSVERGERVAVLGANGSGKTTLALHLNGLLTPTEGVVEVDREPVGRSTVRAVRQRVGVLFQDPDDQLFAPTVAADVAFGPANAGVEGEALAAVVADALAAVGLADVADRPPHHLSYGQKQRAALAGILALRPGALVLDEPTSSLDPAARAGLVSLLDGLGATVVLVTHDLPLALQVCPRAVLLSAGRVVADGPTRELLADERLLAAHRLALPWGFDRRLLAG